MKSLFTSLLVCSVLVGWALTASAQPGAGNFGYTSYPDGVTGEPVPVASYAGAPAVAGTPGYCCSAGPFPRPCCGGGWGYTGCGTCGYGGGCGTSCYGSTYSPGWGCCREPLVTHKVYYPCQPIRNVLKVLAP